MFRIIKCMAAKDVMEHIEDGSYKWDEPWTLKYARLVRVATMHY